MWNFKCKHCPILAIHTVGLYAKGNLIEFSLHICSCPNLTTGSNYSPDQLTSSTYNMIARIMEIEQDLVNRVAPVQTWLQVQAARQIIWSINSLLRHSNAKLCNIELPKSSVASVDKDGLSAFHFGKKRQSASYILSDSFARTTHDIRHSILSSSHSHSPEPWQRNPVTAGPNSRTTNSTKGLWVHSKFQ